jgi:hypothetical protein
VLGKKQAYLIDELRDAIALEKVQERLEIDRWSFRISGLLRKYLEREPWMEI